MENNLKNLVFSKNVIEFVTVSVEYCSYLESFDDETEKGLTNRLTKLLPLLYLKTGLLPETEMVSDSDLEVTVSEDVYNYILSRLYNVYAKDDTYLEVFLEDMKYSETPISASVSEDLADIYQDLKNFISIYEQGIIDTMNDALCLCSENFKNYWGQKLVNVLRALHSLKYAAYNTDFAEDEDVSSDNAELLW